MKRALVMFFAFALVAPAKTVTLPNGNTVDTLANGEVWETINFRGRPIAVRLAPYMPTKGQFRTGVVEDLPKSNIVGAPQSIEIQILGDCESKTVQVWGTLPYEGKMRAGTPMVDLGTGPDGLTRRVEPDSPMGQVFHRVCKP